MKTTMQKFRRATVTTRGLLMGSHDAQVRHFQRRLDKFLSDAQKFDEAFWEVVVDGKKRLYELLELFLADEGKNGNGGARKVTELKKRWKAVRSSGEDLGKDVGRGLKQVQPGKIRG